MLLRVSSMPGVSTTTTDFPPISTSMKLMSLVQDWRSLPTFCFSDVMRLMNCLAYFKVSHGERSVNPVTTYG